MNLRMLMSELLDVYRGRPVHEDTQVRAVTPHGSYTFSITEVTKNEVSGVVLHLKEVDRK